MTLRLEHPASAASPALLLLPSLLFCSVSVSTSPACASLAAALPRLLAHVVVGAHEQLHEDGDRAIGDDDARVLRCARGDVGQRPRRLELEHRVVAALLTNAKTRRVGASWNELEGG
eukprot:157369-Pleurochrysis_carterae.AAC.1